MTTRIAAYANGDDALVAWLPEKPIPGCLGFALYRRRNGVEEIVDNAIGWENIVPPPKPGERKPSNVWPIQRFYWSDYDAARGDKVQYRIVPMVGQPDALQPAENLASDWTPPMLVSPGNPSGIEAYFNRGIVMSQAVARRLAAAGGKPVASLKAAIAKPGNTTRTFLYGQLGQALIDALNDGAKKGYSIYAALFELDDPELIAAIKSYGERAHVILANGAHEKATDDENAAIREELQKTAVDLHDRLVPAKHLAHNKFCIFVDPQGRPEKVWMGSQNWTKTGLCTQANNCLMIHDVEIATAYRKQWDNLDAAGNGFPAALLQSNDEPRHFDVDNAKATLWFTPTRGMLDLADARPFIENAKSAVLFLMFNPGPRDTSLLATILERSKDTSKPRIHVLGVINQDPSSTQNKVVDLFTGEQTQEGNQDVVMPQGLDAAVAKQWMNEITRGEFLRPGGVGHAIVHSKVIVVDPFGDHPVVMTGSHNLGETASSANDENFMIIENDRALAEAYVVNIAAIHNAYRWRFARVEHDSAKKYHGLHPTADWQKPYFENASLKRAATFWIGDADAAAPAPAPKTKKPPVRRRRQPSKRA